MRLDLTAHILAGSKRIVSGFLALYVAKGARVHRRSGMAARHAVPHRT